jgi:lipopolysaccharide export system protein LptA
LGVAVFSGNARAWQDDNFVRADQLTIYRETKRFEGDGHVQSVLYQAKQKNKDGTRSVVPVFAVSERMSYSDADRLLHYEKDVDIRQGTDRVTSETADVYLLKETNEIDRSLVQRNVVLTQPGRRGVGEWGQYTAADETFVLKGNPARVEDTEKGSSESARLTVYLRENRVIADDTNGAQSAGRVHTVHKVTKQPIKP